MRFQATLTTLGPYAYYVTPTMTNTAPAVPADLAAQAANRAPGKGADYTNTWYFNASRQPCIAVPTGLDGAGLPTSMQIAGLQWDDKGVLQLAHSFQGATGHHLGRPRLSAIAMSHL